jgi:hypothetical protein
MVEMLVWTKRGLLDCFHDKKDTRPGGEIGIGIHDRNNPNTLVF